MTAFVPISPAAARQLLTGVSSAGEGEFLSAFVEAGVIRAYAAVVETLDTDGGRSEVRDKRISTALWRRIVAEGKLGQALSLAAVKLDGDGLVGGRPAMTVTGIRFNENNVRKVAAEHGPTPEAKPAKAAKPKPAAKAIEIVEVASPVADAPPLIEVAHEGSTVPAPRGLATDVLCVSINEAAEILRCARSTIYKLRDRGDLVLRKVGGSTVVDADSIRRLLA